MKLATEELHQMVGGCGYIAFPTNTVCNVSVNAAASFGIIVYSSNVPVL